MKSCLNNILLFTFSVFLLHLSVQLEKLSDQNWHIQKIQKQIMLHNKNAIHNKRAKKPFNELHLSKMLLFSKFFKAMSFCSIIWRL